MKIGIVCYPTFGGSGVIATELGLALAREGHSVHFITYNRPARLSAFQENVFFHEVVPYDYPLFKFTPYESALASKIVDVMHHERLDLLHVHYAVPHTIAAYLAKKILKKKGISLPIVTTLHGTDITLVGVDQSMQPVVEFCISKSDGVTSVSESLREETYSSFDIDREIQVIPNFIDMKRFVCSSRDHFRALVAPQGEKVLCHISNFRELKRIQDAIQVFKRVHDEIPAKLLLIGDGPERPKMESLAISLGVYEDCRFLGKQDAIEDLLSISDIFLLPSEKESFGLVALEAMACGVPVVSSNAGGIGEVNIHGVTGFLHPIGDVESMTASAMKILRDDVLFASLKKNALEQANRFDIMKILPQYMDYYKEVLRHSGAEKDI